MQFRSFIQRLTPWLTAYLFLVSVGLPLQRVYCACAGAEWVTMLPEGEHACQRKAALSTKAHPHSAPSAPGSCHHNKSKTDASCTSDGCGGSELLLAQLDTDFTVGTAATFDLGIVAILPPVGLSSWTLKPEPGTNSPTRGPTHPPPVSGRDVLVAHQTFLI